MVKNNLCTAIEALEEFQGKHYDWRWVRNKTEAFMVQLENVLSGFEGLIEGMKEIEKEEAAEANAAILAADVAEAGCG